MKDLEESHVSSGTARVDDIFNLWFNELDDLFSVFGVRVVIDFKE